MEGRAYQCCEECNRQVNRCVCVNAVNILEIAILAISQDYLCNLYIISRLEYYNVCYECIICLIPFDTMCPPTHVSMCLYFYILGSTKCRLMRITSHSLEMI